MDKDYLEYLKSLGISVARGVPQLATGFVDLAALPFTLTGLLKPEQAVGSTDWMTAKGYLPPKQEGLLNETTELLSGAINPASAITGGLLGIGSIAAKKGAKGVRNVIDDISQSSNFNITKTDASDIFGKGSQELRYTDPDSGGFIKVVQKPDGTASVLGLEVPKEFQGAGVGKRLQAQIMADFPAMEGQVSSKAAAKNAYNLGRRPVGSPDASFEDVLKMMDENSSVNLVSPKMQSIISKYLEEESLAKSLL